MATRYGVSMTRAPETGVPLGRIETPRLTYAVIAVCTLGAAVLRFYTLTRPGFLLGVTQYDDAVQFGDALRLVNGVVPYRDFVDMQPPGNTLLMVPAALLAKVVGSAWGFGISRLLTAAADTANVVLLGLLVRHRGPVAAGIACGIYAVYPDALIAAHTFMLEPWLNLFCLIGALLVFRGDEITRGGRLAWGGAAFGFAASVKIWALVPLGVLGLLLLSRPRRLGVLAGGAAAGLAIPVLPFLALAPGAFVNDVLVSQFVRSNYKHVLPVWRLRDLAGFLIFPDIHDGVSVPLLLIAAALVPIGYMWACRGGRQRPTTLDWYALFGGLAVLAMLLWPYDYWSHYGSFAAPFIALAYALPAGLLRPGEFRDDIIPLIAVSVVAVIGITALGARQLAAEAGLKPWVPPEISAKADKLIPPGSCVLTNQPAFTIAADRFTSDVPGCPDMVDAYGTLLALTHGRKLLAPPQQVNSVTAVWRSAFSQARYVWIQTDSQGQIPWTPALYAYFTSHFKLIGLHNGPGAHDVPEGGLYIRR